VVFFSSVFSLLLAVVDYLMRRFGFSCYLLLKIGINFKVFDLISFFIMDGLYLEVVFFLVDFLLISAVFIR
jgi:hypothetical protein